MLVIALLKVVVVLMCVFMDTMRTVLTDTEVKVPEKEIDSAPIQKKLVEPELQRGFKELCRPMKLKWYFRNESTRSTPSSWSLPAGHPILKIFSRQIEHVNYFAFPIKVFPIAIELSGNSLDFFLVIEL